MLIGSAACASLLILAFLLVIAIFRIHWNIIGPAHRI